MIHPFKAMLLGLIKPPKVPFWKTMVKNSGEGRVRVSKYERHQGVRERERRLKHVDHN